MSDSLSGARVEPAIEGAAAPVEPPLMLRASPPPGSLHDRPDLDQLMRIEDKTARIEEKYARTEALFQRVQDKVDAASARMTDVALQSDLIAIRNQVSSMSDRVRRLPGLNSLVMTALVTAVLTAAVTLAALRFIPGILPR